MREQAKHIISYTVLGKHWYVFGIQKLALNKRKPIFTDDVAKALRFFTPMEAKIYYCKFISVPGRIYEVGTYEPVRKMAMQ